MGRCTFGKVEYGVRVGRFVITVADKESVENLARLLRRPVVTRQTTSWKEN